MRRRMNRRYRRQRRRTRILRLPHIANPHVAFNRLKFPTVITSSGSGTFNDVRTLSNITSAANYTDLSGLYDQFAIYAFKIKYIPYNIGNESSVTGNVRGNCCTLVDWNNANLPNSVGTASQWDSFKLVPAYLPHTRYVKISKQHRPNLNSFSVGFDTTNNDNVAIICIGDSFSNSQTQFYIVLTFYIKCFGTR